MTIDKHRKDLIEYRLEQARSAINEAQVLIDNEMYNAAINRIYYGMFYAVLALALKNKFETSKHGQLIGWFNKNFIKNKKIDAHFGRMLKDAFDFRQKGDYATFTKFASEEVIEMHEDMKQFINEIERHILEEK